MLDGDQTTETMRVLPGIVLAGSTGWQAAASLSYADVPALAKDALAGEVASRATGLRAWATSSTEAGCVSGG